MGYRYGSFLFDTVEEACDECTQEYMSGMGANSPEFIAEEFHSFSNEELLEYMRNDGWEGPEGATQEDLLKSLGKLREKVLREIGK